MSGHTAAVLVDMVLGSAVLILAVAVACGWGHGGSDDRDA